MSGRYRRELSVAVAYAGLLLVMALAAPRFYGPDQLRAFVVSNAAVLVAAVGMTMVILCRQIDISIGSIFSICGVVAGLLAQAGLPIAFVGLGTLAAGSGLGAINGSLIAGLGLPSIVVTLATLVIGRESLRYFREGEFVRDLPAGFQWFGAGQAVGQWVVVAIAIGVFGAFAWGMRNLAAGRGHLRHRFGSRGRHGSRASGRGESCSASSSPWEHWRDWPPCSTRSDSPTSTPIPASDLSSRSSPPLS